MRTIIPGSVSPAYLNALRDTQIDFFRSITMDEDKAKWVKKQYPLVPIKDVIICLEK